MFASLFTLPAIHSSSSHACKGYIHVWQSLLATWSSVFLVLEHLLMLLTSMSISVLHVVTQNWLSALKSLLSALYFSIAWSTQQLLYDQSFWAHQIPCHHVEIVSTHTQGQLLYPAAGRNLFPQSSHRVLNSDFVSLVGNAEYSLSGGTDSRQ